MLPPTSPTSSTVALNDVRCSVVATRKVAGHTDYAIRVQTDRFGGEDLVYRRFSAFLQLQQLARRHFQEHAVCCGGDKSCLLTSCLERVFEDTEFPVMQGRFLGKNSKSVVRERVLFLNAFLLELEEALCKCPPVVMARCEKQGCKIIKLLKSFYGCLNLFVCVFAIVSPSDGSQRDIRPAGTRSVLNHAQRHFRSKEVP